MKTNEYLALIYVQSRDLSNLPPGELLVLYNEALTEINEKADAIYQQNRDAAQRRQNAAQYN